MDAYDFSDPVDILPRLDKAFWDGLAAAKWTERRDALRSLRQLASAPRLASGDYADVVRELRKVMLMPPPCQPVSSRALVLARRDQEGVLHDCDAPSLARLS